MTNLGTLEGNATTGVSKFMKNTKAVGLTLAILLAIGATAALLMTKKQATEEKGSAALYEARKTLEIELKALAQQLAPPKAPEKKEKGKDAKAEDAPLQADPRQIAYRKLDVDARLGKSVEALKSVVDRFSGTRSSFEALMLIGGLYYDHGEAAKATDWYQKAVSGAPNSLSKALALSSVGYSYEDSGKCSEALPAYNKAVGTGEEAVKGDVLLAIARCHETLKDSAQAKKTYEQIIAQLPNSPFARAAEINKARLE